MLSTVWHMLSTGDSTAHSAAPTSANAPREDDQAPVAQLEALGDSVMVQEAVAA
jgi:hypothetical protein